MDTFKIRNYILEIVKSFCCLAVTTRHNGNINAASPSTDGRLAYFKMKKCVGFDNRCPWLEKLLDSLVSPIILNCIELLGVDLSLKDSDPYENLHLKSIKENLDIHYKSTNAACRTESNILPLKAKIQCSALKFWEHILSSNNALFHKINEP